MCQIASELTLREMCDDVFILRYIYAKFILDIVVYVICVADIMQNLSPLRSGVFLGGAYFFIKVSV